MLEYLKQRIRIIAAKNAGKTDGKSGIPFPEWEPNSIPYLLEIFSVFKGKLSDLESEILNRKQDASDNDYKKKLTVESLETTLIRAKTFEEEAKSEYDIVKIAFDGSKAESPKSKFARTRSVGRTIYFALLTAMVIGEFAITYPAFETFLGDKNIVLAGFAIRVAILTAIGATALTVAFAHMAGVYLKLTVDREKPTPNWSTRALAIIGVLVFVTIAFLSVLRGAGADTDRLDAIPEGSRKIFVILMFLFLQVCLVLTATGLGFLRHSHHVDELDKVTKHWNDSRKFRIDTEKAITSAKKQISSNLEQVEKDLAAQYLVRSKKIDGKYTKVAAAYITSNLRFRQEKLDGSIDPFKVRPLI
jgi:hypothetical protein